MNTANFQSFDKGKYQLYCTPQIIERDLQILTGLIEGIICDEEINELELAALAKWIDNAMEFGNREPYSSIITSINDALQDNVLTTEEKENILWLSNNYIQKKGYYNIITAGIQKLTGILNGIIADNKINEREITFLDEWVDQNEYLKNCWPYDELYSILLKIKSDGVITNEEKEELLHFCCSIAGSTDTTMNNEAFVEMLKMGFCQIEPSVILQENTFCITGISKKHKRQEIAEMIELYGGYVSDNVSKNTKYLVVCDDKNNCWTYTCYGRKIEQAIKLRKKGQPLVIMHELDLYGAIEGLK